MDPQFTIASIKAAHGLHDGNQHRVSDQSSDAVVRDSGFAGRVKSDVTRHSLREESSVAQQ
jgi:hypothetical protein